MAVKEHKYITTGFKANENGDYLSAVQGWKEGYSDKIRESFENIYEGIAPTPATAKMLEKVDTVRPIKAFNLTNTDAVLGERTQYLHSGKNYAFYITENGEERIAYKNKKGDVSDVFSGGKFMFKDADAKLILTVGDIIKLEKSIINGNDALTVFYNVKGENISGEEAKTTYIFKENAIFVEANIKASSEKEVASGCLNRRFINGMLQKSTRVSKVWHYPENGDQPYEVFDSLTFRNQIAEKLYAYTFLRSEGLKQFWYVESMNGENLPLTFEPCNSLDYTASYSLCFVNTDDEPYQSPDYLGLFKGRNSDFAVGIAPVTKSGDDSTVFVGDKVKLNINITNLTHKDLKFSLKYDIIDYYGNVVDEGAFIDQGIQVGLDKNRIVEVGGKYGAYFLNLYVVSEKGSYREFYPFGLLADYEYKYNDTALWAINSVNCNRTNKDEWVNSGKILAKIGSSSCRINGHETQLWLGDELRNNGITRFLTGVDFEIPEWKSEEESNQIVAKNIEKATQTLDKLMAWYPIKWVEVGSKYNMVYMQEPDPDIREKKYQLWHKYVFTPSHKLITERYPNTTFIPTSDSGCTGFWPYRLGKGYEDENGDTVGKDWHKVQAMDTRIYGPPYMPDAYSNYDPKYGEGLWHLESGMQRQHKYLTELSGDSRSMDFIITEIGYPGVPFRPKDVDYRTQADYNMRTAIICPAYNANVVGYYCMYDRTSYFTGFSTDGEFYFGHFFEHDYYGIVKPKPTAIAFGVLTRQLESCRKYGCYIDGRYDEGWDKGGVRAFAYDTELYGKVVCAWSNYEVLPNGKKDAEGKVGDRKIVLPWVNQWTKEHLTVFKAVGDTVKVVDLMGNATEYKADGDGNVTIPLTGSPIYIFGIK